MHPKLPMALLCSFFLVAAAACSSSGDNGAEIDQLKTDLEASEAARQAAEQEAKEEKERAAAAEEARQTAEQEAAEAEAAVDDAEGAEERANTAEQEAAEAEQARQAAEQEAERLRQEAEEARQEANRAEARLALAGLPTSAGTVIGDTVVPKYGSTTTLTTNPALTLKPSSISSLSGWSGTALSSDSSSHRDDLAVYSNIGPATRVAITTKYSEFGNDTPVREGFLRETITTDDADLIRSSAFPTTEADPKPFKFNHDSDHTMDAPDDGVDDTTTDNDGNLRNDYDTYRVSGNYDGASGHFECTGGTCTVERLGNRYVVGSGENWAFFTPDSAKVSQDDQSYMYFGWWKREQKSDGTLSFATFSGGVNSATSAAESFNLLTGRATYSGPAVGQYAVHQPAGSNSGAGSFTARAELVANFGTNMLSGTVTNFSNASDWTLTLNEASMVGGDVESSDNGTVTWEIGDVVSQQTGGWTAEFFSESSYGGQTPDGVAGEFSAQFDHVGRLSGAFGANKK